MNRLFHRQGRFGIGWWIGSPYHLNITQLPKQTNMFWFNIYSDDVGRALPPPRRNKRCRNDADPQQPNKRAGPPAGYARVPLEMHMREYIVRYIRRNIVMPEVGCFTLKYRHLYEKLTADYDRLMVNLEVLIMDPSIPHSIQLPDKMTECWEFFSKPYANRLHWLAIVTWLMLNTQQRMTINQAGVEFGGKGAGGIASCHERDFMSEIALLLRDML